MIWVVLAILFLVFLFVFKDDTYVKNRADEEENTPAGLAFGDDLLVDLVNKDTDGDGVPNWKEALFGTDPNKKETTEGVPDSVAIEELVRENVSWEEGSDENLTKTEQFSRELFSTITALTQAGVMDETTIDTLSTSLAQQIQNSTQKKIFTLADIKIINDNSTQAIQAYNDTLSNVYLAEKTINWGVGNIMQELIVSGEDFSVLNKLEPIIIQMNNTINKLAGVNTPQTLALVHLDLINSTQKVVEDINDMKLLEADPLVAMVAIDRYGPDISALIASIKTLVSAINQKLNN